MAALIEIERLTKRFGAFTAVDDVSFTVDRGEVVGFLGPNGAGKSTTMKMLAGFVTPTAGTARICGQDVIEAPVAAKRALGYLPEGAPTYPEMTVSGFLHFIARIRGFGGAEANERMARAMAMTQLEGVRDTRSPLASYSPRPAMAPTSWKLFLSTSFSTRSRTVRRPPSCWRFTLSGPPMASAILRRRLSSSISGCQVIRRFPGSCYGQCHARHRALQAGVAVSQSKPHHKR